MRRYVAILVALLQILLAGSLQAVSGGATAEHASLDWPQWRGVNRDGISAEVGLLDAWPEAGPRVLWRVEVGAGYSSVSVAGGGLYTLWDEKESQFLVRLDPSSGEEIWRRALGPSFENYYGNGPRSTPLVVDGVVFAVGTGGRLVAVRAAGGGLLWEHDLVDEYGAELPSYGYSSSPLMVGDRLVIEAGGRDGTFMAFDRKTGKVEWRSARDAPAYSSPIRVNIDGVEQVVFWSAHGLRAVSPEDGAVLWTHARETLCPATGDPLNTGTPIFMPPDRIYISSGSGAALLQVTRKEERFVARTVWTSDEMRSDVNTALLLGDHIYGFDRGTLKCLDAGTGEVRWKARGFQRGSLIAADGKLIVLGEDGRLAIVKASPEAYVEKASAAVMKGRNWTSPTLADGKLYLRNHDELVCLEMRR